MTSEPRTRHYDQAKRRARADEVTVHILDVILKMVEGLDAPEITLDAAAQASQVSVQSVVRRFGSKDGLYAAAFGRARALYRSARERSLIAPDRPAAIVHAQLEIYERWGRALLYLRTQANSRPLIQRELELGRRERRAWLSTVLAGHLSRMTHREDALSKAFALTDVHIWGTFRLDLKMSRRRTEAAMTELLEAWLAQSGDEERA